MSRNLPNVLYAPMLFLMRSVVTSQTFKVPLNRYILLVWKSFVAFQLGVLLNSMKRMLDVLRPKVEAQFKSWGSCIPDGGNNAVPGERLSEVTVMLRAKFRNYLQAVVEKLVENVGIILKFTHELFGFCLIW